MFMKKSSNVNSEHENIGCNQIVMFWYEYNFQTLLF